MVVWNTFQNDARVLKEAETLVTAGARVTVFALHTPGVTRRREVLKRGVQIVRTSRSPLWRLRRGGRRNEGDAAAQRVPALTTSRRALRIVVRLWTHGMMALRMILLRPHVVHAHDVNTLPTGWLVSVICRARLVYDAHELSTDREGYHGFRGLVAAVKNRLMPRANAIITTTSARARFLSRGFGIPRPLVLQNRPRYSEIPCNDRIRDELRLAKAWPIVLYQGGLQQGRGLEGLVHAASNVEDTYFVFIGGGRLEARLKALTTEMGLSNRIFFIPTVSLDDLPHYTASADIGVQPIENTCLNHFTTDSNKLFEYIMAGLPVVASDLPEIRRVVQVHGVGHLVQPGNVEQLATAIAELASNRELRRRVSERARAAACHLNWEAQENALVMLYKQLFTRERSQESVALENRTLQ